MGGVKVKLHSFLTLALGSDWSALTSHLIHPRNDPSTRLWRYSPFWALAPLTRRHHSSLSYARLLHPRIPTICDVSLRTTSSHLFHGFPTALSFVKFPFKNLFWDRFIFHPYNMTRQSQSFNFNIIFIYQAVRRFHIFLRPLNTYSIFFLHSSLPFQSSSTSPFSPPLVLESLPSK